MGGEAQARAIQPGNGRARAQRELLEIVEIAEEAPLRRSRRRAAETRVGVENRQQCHADPRARGGRADSFGELGDVRIGPPIGGVMQIVKFAHAREPGLQHLRVGERRDRLDIVGRRRKREPVHGFAPGPEAVGRLPASFRQARHGALKGVAMKIGEARHGESDARFARTRSRVRLDAGEHSVAPGQARVAPPALGRERLSDVQRPSRHLFLTRAAKRAA